MKEGNVPKGTILIVDDIPANVGVLLDDLSRHGYRILVAESGESALEQVNHCEPDLILLDVMMPGLDGFETCRRLKLNRKTERIPVIFMTALSETMDKVRGFGAGAVDYITKPFQREEVLSRIKTHLRLRRLESQLRDANEHLERRVKERTRELSESNESLTVALEKVEELKSRLEAENEYLQEELSKNQNFEEIIGESDALGDTLRRVEKAAATNATVLILGETGTGKELLAMAIHGLSPRRDQPIVKINCAALPTELIESELFGHEKGAFTSAQARRIGRFELANGGTIFLDEIGDLPLSAQVKLLRVLQEGEFERLGGTATIKVNVRVIAATHRDLSARVEARSFREDLFYRLNVFPVTLPPLRKRLGDVPILTRHLVAKHTSRMGRRISEIPPDVFRTLEAYSWPGNVRELENVIERAVILTEGNSLQLDSPIESGGRRTQLEAGTLRDVERRHILSALKRSEGRIAGESGAAAMLGINPSTLRSRMKKLGLDGPE